VKKPYSLSFAFKGNLTQRPDALFLQRAGSGCSVWYESVEFKRESFLPQDRIDGVKNCFLNTRSNRL
jgi:hypothetical protein